MAFSKDPQVQLNKAFANVGALFAKEVEGRVSTFLDPRSANDTGKLQTAVHKCRNVKRQ